MTPRECEEFLADQESNPTHLESCDSCREELRRLDALDRGLEQARVGSAASRLSPDALPVASWEGASTRSWITVIAVAAIVVGFGLVGFIFLGISPAEGFLAAMSGAASSRYLLTVAKSAPNFLATAPMHVHVMIFIAFIVVNVIFVVLLRRRLRGYDA